MKKNRQEAIIDNTGNNFKRYQGTCTDQETRCRWKTDLLSDRSGR